MSELASIVRATIPSVKLKAAPSISEKQKAKKASRRAYLKAMSRMLASVPRAD
jgi:hypothetical protein